MEDFDASDRAVDIRLGDMLSFVVGSVEKDSTRPIEFIAVARTANRAMHRSKRVDCRRIIFWFCCMGIQTYCSLFDLYSSFGYNESLENNLVVAAIRLW